MDPPWQRSWNLVEDVEEEEDERFLSHGMREFPSPLIFAAYGEEAGLGKEEEAGLGLYDVPGLG